MKLLLNLLNAGYRVCRTAWLRFLGLGKQRLLRTKRRHRGVDERTMNYGDSFHLIPFFQGEHDMSLCDLFVSKCLMYSVILKPDFYPKDHVWLF